MGRLRSALIAATLVSCTRSSGKEKLSRSCNRSSGKGKILFRSCTRSYGKGKLFRSFAQSSGTGKTFWGRKDLLEYLPCQSVCLCSFGPKSVFFSDIVQISCYHHDWGGIFNSCPRGILAANGFLFASINAIDVTRVTLMSHSTTNIARIANAVQ